MPNYPVDEGLDTIQQCTFCYRKGVNPGIIRMYPHPDAFAISLCQSCESLMRHYLSNDKIALERWFSSLYKLKVSDERK